MIHITDTTAINDGEIAERFVRAAVPGNKNPHKHAVAVELRFDIAHSSLPPDVRERLIALAGRRVTLDDVLVIVSRADPSQARNRESARRRLLKLLIRASQPPARRRATRVPRAVRKERLVSKQRRSAVKRARTGRGDD